VLRLKPNRKRELLAANESQFFTSASRRFFPAFVKNEKGEV